MCYVLKKHEAAIKKKNEDKFYAKKNFEEKL